MKQEKRARNRPRFRVTHNLPESLKLNASNFEGSTWEVECTDPKAKKA